MAGGISIARHAVAMVIVTLLTWSPVTGSSPTNCGGQADIVFILDSSGSIGSRDYRHQLNFSAELVADFIVGPKDVQFSAIIFSGHAFSAFGFNTYKTSDEVQEAILNLTYLQGMTFTGQALNLARTFTFTAKNGARIDIPHLACVITDGLSTDAADTVTEAYLLKMAGVSVVAIGVGPNVDNDELTTIASPGLVFNVSDYSVLGAIRAQIKKNVCEELNNNTRKNDSCIIDTNGCVGKPDGNYRACKPECEHGIYYTCSHEYAWQMTCDFGYYKYPNGTKYTARMVYVQESDTCELEATYCPRNPQNYSEVPPSSTGNNPPYESKSCLSSNDSCAGRPNGDYPRCEPECKDGFFITCSNRDRYVMPCALGYYTDSNNNRFTARTVFDAATGKCLLRSSSCPRPDPVPQLPPSGPDFYPDGPGITPQCSGKADILLVLDASGSIGVSNFQVMLTFVAGLTKQFTAGPDNVQFSAIIFSSFPTILFYFSDYKTTDDISKALLSALYLDAGTDTAAAIRLGREVAFAKSSGARDNVGRVCMFFTDGLSENPSATAAEAALMKQMGISVVAVGIGPGTDKTELLTIASSAAQVFEVANFNVLVYVRSALVTTACNHNQSSSCITGSSSERPDGLYPACHPECQQGYYYSCSNGQAKKMPCALGWYKHANGTRFTARMVFVQSSSTCEPEAAYCPRDPQNFPVGPPIPANDNSGNNNSIGYSQCLNGSCVGKPNGNYPACDPDCKRGYYYSCSNELIYKMPCPLGTYTTEDGIRFEARLVYNFETNSCEREVESCPRDPFNHRINPTIPDTSGTQQCSGAADIVFILDTSGSINQSDYNLMKIFVANLTTNFNIGPHNIQFSLIIFSSNAYIIFNFTTYTSKEDVYQAIVAAPYLSGGTDTAAALKLARLSSFSPASGARQGVTRMGMVVTDGLSNNPNETAEESRFLKDIDVTLISVGVGGNVDQGELAAIASSPKLVYNVNNFNVLDAISKSLVTSACNKTVNTSTCVSNNCKGRTNGNYPACDPECKAGYFYSCSNELVYRMDCALAWYNFDNGTRFTARMVYNPTSNTCERQASYCSRDPKDFVVPLPPPQPYPNGPSGNKPCLTAPENCSGKPDGNYPMCYPECQKGFYYFCSGNAGYQMPCPDGWYTDRNQKRFTAKTVYDPSTESCQIQTASCPRQVTESPGTTTTEKPVPVCQAVTDVLFIVDASASIGKDNYGSLITFIATLTKHLNVGPANVQVSALVFSSRAIIEFSFTAYLSNAGVYQAILGLPYYEGLTNTAAALRLARQVAFTSANGARAGAYQVAMVLTDGVSNNCTETATEASLFKQTGVKVLTIGIGSFIARAELYAIASSPSLVYNVSGYEVLSSIIREVVITTCQTMPTTTTTTTTSTSTRSTTTRSTTKTATTTTTLPPCVSGSCSNRSDGTYEACLPECRQGHYYVCRNGTAQQRFCDVMGHTENGNTYTVQGVYDPEAKACRSSSKSCPKN